MSAPNSPAQQRPRRSRKSIAHVPSGGDPFDQGNTSVQRKQDAAASKKSRSKSLGPGGLEALMEASGNRQKALPAIRSILKPTIPLSPPKPIPPRTPRTKTTGNSISSASPKRPSRLPRAAAQPSPSAQKSTTPSTESAEELLVSLRTEEEQAAAAREREKQEAIKRRDERRKSLANRRVSFAPEATLHTWNVVELNEDATSSSEATNSTRRQSNGSTLTANFTHGTQHPPSSDTPDPPSTPPRQDEDVHLPEHRRDVHQKKRRRSSTVPQDEFSDPPDQSSSPSSSAMDDDTQQSFMTSAGDDNDEDDVLSDTDTYRDDDSTAMDLDDDEGTSQSVESRRTDETSGSSSSNTLDERLRAAVEQAGTQNLDGKGVNRQAGDQHEESLDSATQNRMQNESLLDADFAADQEHGRSPVEDGEGEENDTMEMTQAVGGIVSEHAPQSSPSRRSSRISRRRSSGASSMNQDETMDLTTAVGGIRRQSVFSRRESTATVATEDEDMSMELTTVVGGGVMSQIASSQDEHATGTEDETSADMTGQMDMTTAFGRILSPVTERTEPSTENSQTMDFTTAVGAIQRPQEDTTTRDETMTMDMTKVVGKILPELNSNDKLTAKLLMEEEAEHGQLTKSSLTREPVYPDLPLVDLDEPAGGGSPKRLSRSPATPSTSGRQTGPMGDVSTPVHQLTPQPAQKPATPSKTPPNRSVAVRRSSPKKLFSKSTRERSRPSISPASQDLVVNRRATLNPANLQVHLTPQMRSISGDVASPAMLGSPKVAEKLDGRTSLGESAETFTPQGPASRGVHFADPRELELEVDKQREEDMRRESGRDFLEREADSRPEDGNLTASLMIQSLTPKKKKNLKGRKSLAVGSARGLLGKRPAELDEDADESPKRIQGPDRSPVKSIKLPAPPSKEETTGRLTKGPRFSLAPVSGNVSTPVTEEPSLPKATTPKNQTRFRDAPVIEQTTAPPVSFNQRIRGISPTLEQDDEDSIEPIQLQDFLNMINVRFMDLETTKRRHTIAPSEDAASHEATAERKLDDCVAAGVSTIPMLELYQHSCRELKKYISEGRSIVQDIEQDTLEENPALFREYMSAALDVRAIMDNQFKNVKAHARLLSRATWYEWRMKLLDGLKDGLVKIREGLNDDSQVLTKQENLLNKALPGLQTQHDQLVQREHDLEKQAEEFISCNQEELSDARQELLQMDSELEEKRKLLEELQAQKEENDANIARLTARKQQCVAEIQAAQKLCDDYRGWKTSEVAALKAQGDALCKSSGWSVASAEGGCLALTFRRTVSLLLKPASFQPASSDPWPMRLALVSEAEPTTQERFFLQLMRARLAAIEQGSTAVQDVLKLVGSGWSVAARLQNTVSDLALSYITDVAITGDESVAVTASILLREMRTRVLARFEVRVAGTGADFAASTRPSAAVVYGEELKEGRMGEFLAQRIGSQQQQQQQDEDGEELKREKEEYSFSRWSEAVKELETRLIARGKK